MLYNELDESGLCKAGLDRGGIESVYRTGNRQRKIERAGFSLMGTVTCAQSAQVIVLNLHII